MYRPTLLLAASCLAANLAAQESVQDYRTEIRQHREHYKQEFLTSPRSPLEAQDTALLDFYTPNPTWRIATRFERTPEAQPFDLPTYSGQTRKYVRYGIAYFEVDGVPRQLSVYQNLQLATQEAYRDYLFLPFKDHSNGDQTYGGGRYLDFRMGDISPDGRLVLDFNKAYNPWCAYSDGYSCPIPPAENHLDMPVPAGEKNFRGEKKH